MMTVLVRLGPSLIHRGGLGIFAVGPISSGVIVWLYKEPVDYRIYGCHRGGHDLDSFIRRFAYRPHGKTYIEVPGDLGCYFNHSDTPNCGDFSFGVPDASYALRDIKDGEELTQDYRTFDEGGHLCSAFLSMCAVGGDG